MQADAVGGGLDRTMQATSEHLERRFDNEAVSAAGSLSCCHEELLICRASCRWPGTTNQDEAPTSALKEFGLIEPCLAFIIMIIEQHEGAFLNVQGRFYFNGSTNRSLPRQRRSEHPLP